MARPRLTDEQRRQNRIDATVQRFKALRIGKCVTDTATKFQEMIRVEAAACSPDGLVSCCSCSIRVPLGNHLDAGHWIGRKQIATIFDERNCHPQCVTCNRFDNLGDAKIQYNQFMRRTYGRPVMDELVRLSNTDLTYTREELAELRYGFMARIKAAKS